MSFMDALFARFTKQAPVTVTTRALFAHILAPPELDSIFQDKPVRQYEGPLLFSSVVNFAGVGGYEAKAVGECGLSTTQTSIHGFCEIGV